MAHSPSLGLKAEHLVQTNFHSKSINFLTLQLQGLLDPKLSASWPTCFLFKGHTLPRTTVPRAQPFP